MIIDPYNFQPVKILDKQLIADDTVTIIVSRPNGYDFLAGQYTIIKSPMSDGTNRLRQYSFASSPNSDNIEFLIRRQPGGEVSNWFLDQAGISDSLQISSALGKFTIPKGISPLLIAGGSGIAPFLSMIRDSNQNLTLLYSERTKDKLCYPEELSSELGANYHPVISSETGRIDHTKLSEFSDYKSIYICGSKLFADDIYKLLVDSGVEATIIKRELFTLQ